MLISGVTAVINASAAGCDLKRARQQSEQIAPGFTRVTRHYRALTESLSTQPGSPQRIIGGPAATRLQAHLASCRYKLKSLESQPGLNYGG